MERIQPIAQPPLGVCEQPQCSLNATNLCMNHAKRVCDTCSALFHYDCDLRIKNCDDFVHAIFDAVNYIDARILDEGFQFGVNTACLEFEGDVRDMKDKVKEFNRKYEEAKDEAFGLFHFYDESRKLIKDVVESQAYQLLFSFKSRAQICNKLSNFFDEEEAVSFDNIRAQFHLKAMKIEQEFKENILKSLSKDLMTTFNNSIENMTSRFAALMEECKQRFEDTNDRITQEAKSSKEEIFLLKQELIETINQNDEDKNIKIDDMKKKLKILKKKTKSYKLSNEEILEDLSKTFNNKFEDILSKHDTTSSNIDDIIANSQHDKAKFKKKVNDLSSNLIAKIQFLETNDLNLLERTKDLDQNIGKRLTSINYDLSKTNSITDKLSNNYEDLKKTFEEFNISIKDTLSKLDDKAITSHKEITKSNDAFSEFKTESEKQFADLKNKQIEFNDEFEESKQNLNKVKEELSQKITSEISILSDNMKNYLAQIQKVLKDTDSLRLKLNEKTGISDLKQLRSEINKEISKLYSYVNYHSFALDKVFMDICLDTKDSKKEVFKIFMSNKVKEMSIHVDEDALMQHIDDIFNKNYTMKDSISEVQKVFSNISKICKLKEADNYEIDFSNDEDIEEVQLISKYKIKFPDTKSLTIKYDNKGSKEMKMMLSNSFPSQLTSLSFIGKEESLSRFFRYNSAFDSDKFRCVECLQITNSSILIQNYIFDEPKQLCDSIRFFKKAQCIEFKDCDYDYCEVGMEDIEFEGVMIKHIVFTDCWFANTKMIKKVIIDSELEKMLDKVTFNGFNGGKGGVERMVEEYKNETGNINFEVV